jgi:RNA-directed DNA polymerase
MSRFDDLMRTKYPYFRYVDDIVVVCRTNKAEGALSFIERKLKEIGLVCHPNAEGSKTKIVPLSKGIDYSRISSSPWLCFYSIVVVR